MPSLMKNSGISAFTAVLLLVLCGSSVQAVPTAATFSHWSSFGFNAQDTNYNSLETKLSTTNVSTLKLKWQVGPSSYQYGYVPGLSVTAGGIDYFGLSDGTFYAVKATTGATIWTYNTGQVLTTPMVVNGVVYVLSGGNDALYALNASTGSLLWQYTIPGAVTYGAALVVNGNVYFESVDPAVIYAVNAASGSLSWSYTAPQNIGGLASAGGLLYFISDGNMTALAAKSGHLRWSTPFGLGGEWSASVPLVSNGTVYGWDMIGSSSGKIEAFSAATGTPGWADSGNWFSQDLTLANGLLYCDCNNAVTAIDPVTGATQWSIPSEWAQSSAPGGLEGANGLLFYYTSSGQLAAADASTGAQLWVEPSSDPGPVEGVSIADGQVMFGDTDGNMVDLQVTKGN